jgi:hypothetical protein
MAAANTSTRAPFHKVVSKWRMPLVASASVKQGNMVGAKLGTYTAEGLTVTTGPTSHAPLGMALADASQANGDSVEVNLGRRVRIDYLDNDTVDACVLATHFQKVVFWKNDHTVSAVDQGLGVAGILWDVDSVNGVGVELKAFHYSAAGLSGPGGR